MVEKLRRELIAKRATPSLKRKQSEQLLKAKDLVKELNAEQEAAKMLVETLKRGLIAETATSTEARKQVKASSIEWFYVCGGFCGRSITQAQTPRV